MPETSQSPPAGGDARAAATPRVWVLTDDRPGNSSQSLGLAEALGWPFERKELRMTWLSALHNRLLGASRAGVDRASRAELAPPWPDLVIAAGRRCAPVARWIRLQSGGRSRLVLLGRKGGDHADDFDLVVTPAYARLFAHPRRIRVEAPLHRIAPAVLAAAREAWRARLEALPAPRCTVLIGGNSGQYRLDAAQMRELGDALARRCAENGGSLLVTTSRRTPPDAVRALREATRGAPGAFHAAGDAGDNPFLGFLAWADAFVITADSESMLAEAASVGRPLEIFPLRERISFALLRFLRDAVLVRAQADPPTPLARGCRRLIELGFVRPARDLSLYHAALRACGVARPFGAEAAPSPGAPLRETEVVAQRVRALFEPARRSSGGAAST